MDRNFEAKKRIIESGSSKIYKGWKEMGDIKEEDFIKELEWLCDDPLDEQNRLTRELGYEVDARMTNDVLHPFIYENGKFYHLKRINGEVDDDCTTFYYDDTRAGKKNHTVWHTGNYNHYSISARDLI